VSSLVTHDIPRQPTDEPSEEDSGGGGSPDLAMNLSENPAVARQLCVCCICTSLPALVGDPVTISSTYLSTVKGMTT
jgi:hypothetical protein